MAFITGLMLVDAPAAALNNSNQRIQGSGTDNTVAVKFIRTPRGGDYPYVSAQAFRAWLRGTLEQDQRWKAATSPITRQKKGAFTEGDPLQFWDDDLFGYMRAEKRQAKGARAAAANDEKKDDKDVVTRLSPFRVSTLVAIAPVNIVNDFGTMSRHDGDPVPFEHQFYHATLQGLWSLNLALAGTFSSRDKTGYKNLDEPLKKKAQAQGLTELPTGEYRLPTNERLQRVRALLDGLSHIEGGAKLTLHYTDISPVVVIMAVTRGGNHIFGHVVSNEQGGLPSINIAALDEALRVGADDILSDVYIGWVRGYRDSAREQLEATLGEQGALVAYRDKVKISHPREAFTALSAALADNPEWLD